jgi:hypothetical protein
VVALLWNVTCTGPTLAVGPIVNAAPVGESRWVGLVVVSEHAASTMVPAATARDKNDDGDRRIATPNRGK